RMRAGALVNDFLLQLSRGRPPTPAIDAARVLSTLLQRPHPPDRHPPLADRVLVSWVDGSARIADLVLPVVEVLGAEAMVLVAHEPLRGRVPAPAGAISEGDLGLDG